MRKKNVTGKQKQVLCKSVHVNKRARDSDSSTISALPLGFLRRLPWNWLPRHRMLCQWGAAMRYVW